MMDASRKITTLILGTMFLVLLPHGPTVADQVKVPAISAGTAATRAGSLINVGQSAVGKSRSVSHRMDAGAIPVLVALTARALRGDLDRDGDVDLDDHTIFAACLNGPDISIPPRECTPEQFELADIQSDRDVDLSDFRELSAVFTGG